LLVWEKRAEPYETLPDSDKQMVQSGEKIAEALAVGAIIDGPSISPGQDETV